MNVNSIKKAEIVDYRYENYYILDLASDFLANIKKHIKKLAGSASL